MSHPQILQPIIAMGVFCSASRESRLRPIACHMPACASNLPLQDVIRNLQRTTIAEWEGIKHDHACRGECLALHSWVGTALGWTTESSSRPINGGGSLSACKFTDMPILGHWNFPITCQMRSELVVVGVDSKVWYQAKPRPVTKLGTCSIDMVRN
jgi:hypothetical protein